MTNTTNINLNTYQTQDSYPARYNLTLVNQ